MESTVLSQPVSKRSWTSQNWVAQLPKWLLLLTPIVVYFTVFAVYHVNAPIFDDFQAILNFINSFERSPNRLHELFAVYVEHRIVYLRLVTLATVALLGHVDFTVLALIGNFSLVGILLLLAVWFRQQGLFRYFLTVPFMLLHLNFHHNTFSAMMALQNLTILLWALLCFYCLTRTGSGSFLLGILFAIIGVYTSGNGLAILLAGFYPLLLQRRWKQLAIWSAAVACLLVGYFSDLHTNQDYLTVLQAKFLHIAGFFVFFCGNYLDLFPNVLYSDVSAHGDLVAKLLLGLRLGLTFLAGILVAAGSALFVVRPLSLLIKRSATHWHSNERWAFRFSSPAFLFLATSILFVLLTAAMTAVGRIEVGIAQSFAVRYKIYSPVLCILLYSAWLSTIHKEHRKTLYSRVLTVSVLLWANSYYQHLNQVQQNHRSSLAGLFNFKASGTWATMGIYYGDIDRVLQQAVARGVYRPAYRQAEPLSVAQRLKDLNSTQLPVRWQQEGPLLTISNQTTPSGLLTGPAYHGSYVVLQNSRQTYLLNALPNRGLLGQLRPGFRLTLDLQHAAVPKGCYLVYILTLTGGSPCLFDTGRRIDIV